MKHSLIAYLPFALVAAVGCGRDDENEPTHTPTEAGPVEPEPDAGHEPTPMMDASMPEPQPEAGMQTPPPDAASSIPDAGPADAASPVEPDASLAEAGVADAASPEPDAARPIDAGDSGANAQATCDAGFDTELSLINGDFEEPVVSGGWLTLQAGATELVGWEIEAGNLDVIGTTWVHASGNGSLDMNGTAPARISQSVSTVAGQWYEVRFFLAGNMGAGPTVKTLRVSAGATVADYSFNISGHSYADMGWVEQSFRFQAMAETTLLAFESTAGAADGPALDDVRLFLSNCAP